MNNASQDTEPEGMTARGCLLLIVVLVASWLIVGLFVASIVWLVMGLAGWWASR